MYKVYKSHYTQFSVPCLAALLPFSLFPLISTEQGVRHLPLSQTSVPLQSWSSKHSAHLLPGLHFPPPLRILPILHRVSCTVSHLPALVSLPQEGNISWKMLLTLSQDRLWNSGQSLLVLHSLIPVVTLMRTHRRKEAWRRVLVILYTGCISYFPYYSPVTSYE